MRQSRLKYALVVIMGATACTVHDGAPQPAEPSPSTTSSAPAGLSKIARRRLSDLDAEIVRARSTLRRVRSPEYKAADPDWRHAEGKILRDLNELTTERQYILQGRIKDWPPASQIRRDER